MGSNRGQRLLLIAIQGRGSSTVRDIGILRELLRKDTGFVLEPLLEDDIYHSLELLKRGKVDFFYEYDWSAAWIEGKVPEMVTRSRGPFQMRMVASAHSGAIGFMVRADSRIRTIYDIRSETRLAVVNRISDLGAALLAWLGMDGTSPRVNPLRPGWPVELVSFSTMEASLRSIGEGRADVVVAAPENPVVKEMAARPPGVRFLELPVMADPGGVARFRRVLPYGQFRPAPRRGVKEIWGLTSYIGSACLWCRDDFDAELAYTLTKWFDENYDRYREMGNKLDTYSREALRDSLDAAIAPVHEGTIRYFKEIGRWRAVDDVRQEYNRRVMDRYCEAWARALARADALGIEVSSENARWLDLWAGVKMELGVPPYRALSDNEVHAALRRIRRE